MAAAAALVLVFVLRLALDDRGPIPLHTIPQGMSVQDDGAVRAFVRRDGSALTAFSARFDGRPLWWCPYEEVFWAPPDGALFDREGRHVFGTKAGMTTVQTSNSQDLLVTFGSKRAEIEGPTGKINADVFEFYQRYLDRGNVPSARKLVFCPNPLQ